LFKFTRRSSASSYNQCRKLIQLVSKRSCNNYFLSLEKHVSNTCATGFYWLCQLWRIRRSLDDTSAATLVHAFVTSRVDYCSAVYAGAPKTITDKLQRVLNAAARVVSDTKKIRPWPLDPGFCTMNFIGLMCQKG